MSLFKLLLDGLRFHWRTNLAVLLAVTIATAVLTGALLVGDSMRGSLRHLLLDQLGSIDEVLVTDRFFRAELADELARSPRFGHDFSAAVPAIVVQGTVENPRSAGALRAGQVTVIGSDERFWKLGPPDNPSGAPAKPPGRNEIVLNATLADEIGAKPGDEVLLRMGSATQIPPDSALGRKLETVRSRRLTVSAVIPSEGLGRFALRPNQQLPLNAYVATKTLADALEQQGKVNAILVAGRENRAPTAAAHEALQAALQPKLIDYGLTIEAPEVGSPEEFVQITSNRMLLDDAAVKAVDRAFANEHPQAIYTYLANGIAAADKSIPYSTIAAIDFVPEPPLGPFKTPEGEPIARLADDEIVLNTWAADDLGAKPGDEIAITYFEPESTHGKVSERTAKFRLKAICALAGLAADKHLTPQLPGVTDQLSIGDWDPPFPFEQARVRDKDEAYWDEYRTTPKAFISLAAGRKLWASRFGDTTSLRFAPPPDASAETLATNIKLDPPALGFAFMPAKALGLAAASGTTPFDMMFVGFSLFIMISTLVLVALLFRLGIEQRAASIGVLRAVGLRSRKVATILAGEGAIVAAVGALVGVLAGVGYAWLMLTGLTTWWVSAIGTPFLQLYVTPRSLAIGYVSGLVVSLCAMLWTLRRLGRLPIRRLLAGQAVAETARFGQATGGNTAAIVLLVLAALLAAAATRLAGEAQAGAFVGAGTLVLIAGVLWIGARLRRGATAALVGGNLPIARLALRNGARNPTRSTLSIGLIAAASFLIVALSAFRLDPASEGLGRASGSGGFSLVAESSQPIYQNLATPAGRAELGFSDAADKELSPCEVIGLRVQAGDDASCLNLYQTTQPRMLGVPPSLIERGGFAWASSAADTPEEQANPWLLLQRKLPPEADGTPVLPAVLDFNTAQYSLHKGSIGARIEVEDGRGRPLQLEIVGLLKNSVFQGDVLVSEAALVRYFPEVSGYRFFLIDTHDQPLEPVRAALESALGDYGFDAQSSLDRLAGFFAVQNTYLSTFQSLGGLGLLLGTFGLATVQLRSVLERRGELALLRATGFRRWLLARLVMIENSLLLVAGLSLGVAAALVAVLPHWLAGRANIPWLSLAVTLLVVLLAGLAAGAIAVRAVLAAELLPALREEQVRPDETCLRGSVNHNPKRQRGTNHR